MSGSEFERENIVTDALSAAPASKPAESRRIIRSASTRNMSTLGDRPPRASTI